MSGVSERETEQTPHQALHQALEQRNEAKPEQKQAQRVKESRGQQAGKPSLRPPKRIAVLNDLSGYGRCSLTVALPVISALGVEACPIPTAILSNHTGFPSEYKYDFTDHMKPYMEAWEQMRLRFDGIITGYMNYDAQVDASAAFISKFKRKQTVVVVDPAMADHGKLYRGFTPEYVEYVKENLIRRATIIKPNLTEACLLTGFDYHEVQRAAGERTLRRLKSYLINMIHQLAALGPQQIVITGIERNDRIMNAIADNGAISFLSVKKAGRSRGGTGDIFTSILSASVVQGMSLPRAVDKAADFISEAIRISDEANVPVNNGVIFESIMSKLASTSYERVG